MDNILEAVIYRMRERSELGIKKYGTTLDRNDLSHLEWLNHLQEELMDAILYLQKIKHNEIKGLSKEHKGSSNSDIKGV
jgi:hypothetical protein